MNARSRRKIQVFYENHRRQLFVCALSITRCQSSAEDAIHSAFARVLQRDELPEELRPYLFACVRNAAKDELRKQDSERRKSELFKNRLLPSRNGGTEDRLEAEMLLEQPTPDERDAIVLRLYSGLTYQEVADLDGTSVNTIASRYRRGIEKIRAYLEELE